MNNSFKYNKTNTSNLDRLNKLTDKLNVLYIYNSRAAT